MFVTFGMKGQVSDKNGYSKHYMASVNIVNLAASSSHFIQITKCKNLRHSISIGAGLTATFDGYTIGQIVKALRNTGLLA